MVESRKLARNIVGLNPELAERGRIKIGGKGQQMPSKLGGTYQQPVRYDHFVITSMTRGADGNFLKDEVLHRALSEKGFTEPLTAIPFRLLFNDPSLNFSSGYGIWDQSKKAWWCNGDGESAQRLQDDSGELTWIDCPCALLGDRCKIKSRLRGIIDEAPGLGGIWTFMCASWNSTRAIAASLAQLTMLTRGHIAGLPLRLVMRPKTVYPKKAPASVIQVVSLEFPGDMDQLLAEAAKAMQLQVGYEKKLAEWEKQLANDTEDIIPDEDAEEFYPAQPEPEIRRRAKQSEQSQQSEQSEQPPPLATPTSLSSAPESEPNDDDSPF